MSSQEKRLHIARVVSVVAGTVIALACGTNYAFSAWGPQFAVKMHLSSTEQNLVATFGNLGMYLCGIPVGMMTDRKGAKPGVIGGSVSVGFGYYMLHRAYEGGPGSTPLPWLCIFNFFTGLGGCAAFSGAVKVSALNWPQHRGSATAFPLAAFGLSAFFFASLSRTFAPNDTSDFLLILSIGGFCLIFIPLFFLRVVPATHGYKPIGEDRGNRNKLQRIDSAESRKTLLHGGSEPDASASSLSSSLRSGEHDAGRHSLGSIEDLDGHDAANDIDDDDNGDDDEDGELHESAQTGVETPDTDITVTAESAHRSVYADVRGAQMLKYIEFYQFFILMGLLTGIGLMTINNIGNNAQALWSKFDPSVPIEEIRHRQSVHVSLLSICSFLGRLTSGIGSDLVVKKLHLSRLWCVFGSSVVFTAAQAFGLGTGNPNLLFCLSGLTGLGYGFLFGCFPSVVAETFGIGGLGTNWGVLTLAPVFFANVFNILYGRIYDAHSAVSPDNRRVCDDGRFCYHAAYWGTFAASLAAGAIVLWSIWHQRLIKDRLGWKGEGGGHLS